MKFILKIFYILLLIYSITTLTKLDVKASNDNVDNQNKRIIFIGDSRTVGMYQAYKSSKSKSTVGKIDDNGDIWVAKTGIGLSWMQKTAVPSIEKYIDNNTTIIIMMGVNDCKQTSEYKDYIEYINEKAIEWSQLGAETIYMSVNPISNTTSYSTNNNHVVQWNNNIKENLNKYVEYFDTYSTILDHTYYSKDGLHYKNQTSLELYYLVVNKVRSCKKINEADNLNMTQIKSIKNIEFVD